MWLNLGGVYSSGTEALDLGISDSLLVTTAQGSFLAVTTGTYGGISIYRIGAGGTLALTGSFAIPDNLQLRTGFDIAHAEINGQTIIFFGATANTMTGVRLNADGSLGPIRHVSMTDMEAAHLAGAEGALYSQTRLSDLPTGHLPGGNWHDNTVAVYQITLAGQSYTIALGALDEQVYVYRQTNSGSWLETGSLGAQNGLGIAAPSAMEMVTLQGQTYILVASSAGSAISVLRLTPDGGLEAVQHLIDTASTRFANVQDLAVAQHGDHVFVFALGTDHGVSMFRLLPDGHLIHMQSWADGAGGGLHTPQTVTTFTEGTTLNVMIGAQNSVGVTHFTLDLASMGTVRRASDSLPEALSGTSGHDILIAGSDNDTLTGGGGHDILVSGPGRSTMTGGAGADTFVIRATSTAVTITDFRAGQDRLDLTDLPMLRSLAQLQITPSASGAILSYRGVTITITAHDGRSLSAEDIFPQGLTGPDALLIVLEEIPAVAQPPGSPLYLWPAPPLMPMPPPPPAPETVPGNWIIGRDGRDTLTGGNGHDYIYGGDGPDLIRGGAGNDTLFGGFGHDTIYGGAGHDLIVGGPGNDRMWGEDGNDTIFGISGNNRFGGGAGDDLLVGGTGNDTIYGGTGNDTIYGNAGNNSLWGMRGDDLIIGGPGNDRIGGGRGNDTIYGGGGRNTIYGGMGDDLIFGGDGGDVIWGMDDNDTIFGGAGNDYIHGGRGDDVLSGGPGDDTLRGGPGADVFIFNHGHERLLIEDFTFAENDRLQLDEALWGGGLSAEEVVGAFGSVTNGRTVLDFGGGDRITLAGVSDLEILVGYIDIV
ncbi:calcium-binding protein [Natronohydrobacter thiooxidans]|uniref:calcium-binding protein n=1 Tax=Natronohydrobacter thiooxidans TaxID=87172 RepID=UPI0008FF4D3C|nr:calcium-binding protein [Natronohydrobacter thiooxidans]